LANILGELTLNEISIVELDGSPIISGVNLPVGSYGVNTNNGFLYLKTGAASTDWQFVGPRTILTASQTGDVTTTSTTDVLLPGLTLTPPAGQYLASFHTSLGNGNNGAVVFANLYVDGTLQTASQVRVQRQNQTVIAPACIADFPITVNGAQAVEARWRVSGGTGTSYDSRFLSLRRVG
jgi:hypothetical protein